MMRIEDAEVGRTVIYSAWEGGPTESGVITSFNHKNIFVRYGNELHAKATTPSDIEYEM